MMKRGYIYSVRDYDKNPHKIVLMEDYDGVSTRIKAVAFTHDEIGSPEFPNKKISKKYIAKTNRLGNKYKFQWERQGVGRSTSIITKGFLKLCVNIKPQIIGRVTEDGMKWLDKQNIDYIICDISIKTKASQQPSK